MTVFRRKPPNRTGIRFEQSRSRIPLPEDRRALVGFVLDAARGCIIAPWQRGKAAGGDLRRLDAVVVRAERIPAGAGLFWLWPDREPEPITDAPPNWVIHWSQDRAIYGLRPVS